MGGESKNGGENSPAPPPFSGTPRTRRARAQDAAGVIHSDLARGFIRAEVTHYDDFVKAGSMAKAKEAGHLRLEGKDYIVQDGDIMLIRFNV